MNFSIGTILRKSREKRRLTIDDVFKATKIRPEYILALEKDNYSIFSGKVHSKGFLKVYAQFLGLNLNELLALWRREYEGNFDKKEKVVNNFLGSMGVEYPRFNITPTLLLVFSISLLILVFFGYLFFQYRSYTADPMLELYNPKDNDVVISDILDITGKTDLDVTLFVNNQKVILNPDGSFGESVKLKEGLNVISIKATNKLSKSTELVRTVIFRPKEQEVPVMDSIMETTESTKSLDAVEE